MTLTCLVYRYFVIKVVEEGKAAHLGLGFADRKAAVILVKPPFHWYFSALYTVKKKVKFERIGRKV
jgi:hypothetical protein